jgi:hypothetical protein
MKPATINNNNSGSNTTTFKTPTKGGKHTAKSVGSSRENNPAGLRHTHHQGTTNNHSRMSEIAK